MKKGRIITFILLIIFCFTSYAFAAYSPRLDGKPEQLIDKNTTGYFLWQDRKGLHIRAIATGTPHVFSGSIKTDGDFVDIFSKAPGADDYSNVNNDNDKITFQLTALNQEAGIDLHVNGGTYVTFNLSIDGQDIDPNQIFIGGDSWHPASHKFTFSQRNHHGYPDDDRTVIFVDPGFWWPFLWLDPGPGPGGPGPHGPHHPW
ncbi:MAG: hypothetical protein H6Q74_974 [Firmicutes bacterium]|nr:hypothetical protein [Bacillota bacterium]